MCCTHVAHPGVHLNVLPRVQLHVLFRVPLMYLWCNACFLWCTVYPILLHMQMCIYCTTVVISSTLVVPHMHDVIACWIAVELPFVYFWCTVRVQRYHTPIVLNITNTDQNLNMINERNSQAGNFANQLWRQPETWCSPSSNAPSVPFRPYLQTTSLGTNKIQVKYTRMYVMRSNAPQRTLWAGVHLLAHLRVHLWKKEPRETGWTLPTTSQKKSTQHKPGMKWNASINDPMYSTPANNVKETRGKAKAGQEWQTWAMLESRCQMIQRALSHGPNVVFLQVQR